MFKNEMINKQLFSNWIINFFLTLLLCTSGLLGFSQKNKGKSGSGNTGYILLKPKYDGHSVLRNPLNGWVMYAPRNADDTYWDIEYFVPALGKKVKVIDYASACYVRTSWSSLNPSDGVYAWDDPNSKIGKMVATKVKIHPNLCSTSEPNIIWKMKIIPIGKHLILRMRYLENTIPNLSQLWPRNLMILKRPLLLMPMAWGNGAKHIMLSMKTPKWQRPKVLKK